MVKIPFVKLYEKQFLPHKFNLHNSLASRRAGAEMTPLHMQDCQNYFLEPERYPELQPLPFCPAQLGGDNRRDFAVLDCIDKPLCVGWRHLNCSMLSY